MKIAKFVMAGVFVLCIAVQYNDPDALQWSAYYAYGLIVTVASFFRPVVVPAAIGVVGYVIGFAYYLPGWSFDTVMLLREPKMSSEDVELAREAFGLLICAVWLAVLAVYEYRVKHRDAVPTRSSEEAPE